LLAQRQLRYRFQHYAQKKTPTCQNWCGAKPGSMRSSAGTADADEGLPLAYNKDLQEDKSTFDAVKNSHCLEAMTILLRTDWNFAPLAWQPWLRLFQCYRCRRLSGSARRSLREAYNLVGKVVKLAMPLVNSSRFEPGGGKLCIRRLKDIYQAISPASRCRA